MSARRPTWQPAVLALLVASTVLPSTALARKEARSAPSLVTIDGEQTAVRWIDGDTFRILDGERAGTSARLEGFNTLEGYGPVHRWGRWEPSELLAVARDATRIAASRRWECRTRGRQDRYRRLLVSCPELAASLVASGHAMVFAVGAPPDPVLVALQADAQRRRAGMWAKGVPAQLVSSVHSRAEGAAETAYDRLVDTRTGDTHPRSHDRFYRTCEEICAGEGEDRACMVYVPFERRYRGRPACLRMSEAAGQGDAVRDRDQ